MSATKHQPPDVAPETGSDGVVIFIHFGLPHEFSIVHSIYWPGPLLILARAIEGLLRVDRLIVEGSLGSHGVLSEGMISFASTDRNRAIACVKQCLISCGLLAHCVEIAWQDDDECILRTHLNRDRTRHIYRRSACAGPWASAGAPRCVLLAIDAWRFPPLLGGGDGCRPG